MGLSLDQGQGVYSGWSDVDGSSQQPPCHTCIIELMNQPFIQATSKNTLKPRVTGLCVGNSPVIGEFSAQMANGMENVSIWWRHHVTSVPGKNRHRSGFSGYWCRCPVVRTRRGLDSGDNGWLCIRLALLRKVMHSSSTLNKGIQCGAIVRRSIFLENLIINTP